MPRKAGPHTEFLKKSVAAHKTGKDSEKSTQWLRDMVVKLAHGDGDLKTKKAFYSRRANKVGDGPTNRIRLGNMYFFLYDPLLKKTLPYYDTFPLIIAYAYAENGNFYGLNLHYLPPSYRAALLDKIIEIFQARGMTDESKFKLTISMLRKIKDMPEFGPCIKQYKPDHVRSLFQPVPPEEWQYSVLLNAEAFKKASKYQVWKDSLKRMSA